MSDESEEKTFQAQGYMEVRSVFGGERDDDFDWTRFDIGESNLPEFPSAAAPFLIILGTVAMAVHMSRE